MTTEIRITDPKTGGEKGQKAERFDLFPFDALEEVARVYSFGARKYADDNWLKGYAWRLSLGALLRHVSRFAIGEDRDPETGCLHLAHAAWHCLTLITFILRKRGTDDRAKAAPVVEDENLDEDEIDWEAHDFLATPDPEEPIPFKVAEPIKVVAPPRAMRPTAPYFMFDQEGDASVEAEKIVQDVPVSGAV